MANLWLRLWHDMPNDPKWRTISRISGQPMALVQAVYIHLLASASQNVTRGHADVTNEDLASHFDVTERDIESVIDAMQGRVLDGSYLTGWERRQPKREDTGNEESGAKSAVQRKREQRERQREKKADNTQSQQCHEESRNVTTDKEEIKIRDLNPTHITRVENFPESQASHPAEVVTAISPSGKFPMSSEWVPSPDFFGRAGTWGMMLNPTEFKPEYLTAFIDYWMSEGKVFNHVQWEQKFARHLVRIKNDRAQKSNKPALDFNNTDWINGIRDGKVL